PTASEAELPEDTLVPEPGTGLLRDAGKGRTARARITYRLVASAFHDNMRMTPADAAYAYSFAYRWGAGAGGRAAADSIVEAATAPLRQALVGFRVVKVDAEVKKYTDITFTYVVPVIDVYVQNGALDEDSLAALVPPWSAVPWPVMVLMEEAVRRGLAAFSQAEAKRRGGAWPTWHGIRRPAGGAPRWWTASRPEPISRPRSSGWSRRTRLRRAGPRSRASTPSGATSLSPTAPMRSRSGRSAKSSSGFSGTSPT